MTTRPSNVKECCAVNIADFSGDKRKDYGEGRLCPACGIKILTRYNPGPLCYGCDDLAAAGKKLAGRSVILEEGRKRPPGPHSYGKTR